MGDVAIRIYLDGVRVNPCGGDSISIESTNGHEFGPFASGAAAARGIANAFPGLKAHAPVQGFWFDLGGGLAVLQMRFDVSWNDDRIEDPRPAQFAAFLEALKRA